MFFRINLLKINFNFVINEVSNLKHKPMIVLVKLISKNGQN